MKKIEIVSWGIAILGFLMNVFSSPGSGAIFTIGVGFLMFWYLSLGFAAFNNYNFKPGKASWVIAGIASGFFMSAAVAGILFKWMVWPGYSANLFFGFVGLAAVLSIRLILDPKNSGWSMRANWIRLGAIGVITPLTYLITAPQFMFPDNPETEIAKSYKKWWDTGTSEDRERFLFLSYRRERAIDSTKHEERRRRRAEE